MTDFLFGFIIGLGGFTIGLLIGYKLIKNKKVDRFLTRHIDPILDKLRF